MRPHQNHRGGFTLTELLVVIAIIAILASLAAWGVMAMIKNRQRSNTEATMRVLNKLLQTRWAHVIAEAKKERPSPRVLSEFAGGDPEVAKVLWIKVRLAEAFPKRYSEMRPAPADTVVNRYIPTDRRKPYFHKYQKAVNGLAAGGAGESSACLLLALNSILSDGVTVEDQIKYAISDTDGKNKINCVIDGFGTPLKFEPFFINAPNPSPPGSRNFRFADPTDSDGRLLVPVTGWYSTQQRDTFFESFFHMVSKNDVDAYYVVPMIWSLGPDRDVAVPNGPPVAADNIYTYKLGVE
jgi:prepilin-type N-terminal cleavage/methylation domain-containing protein